MKTRTQFVLAAGIVVAALPLMARFVPGSLPWFDAIGLLGPMQTLGVVAAPVVQAKGPPRLGGPASVIVQEVVMRPLNDTVTAIGSARGANTATISTAVTGRIAALGVASGERVQKDAILIRLDDEAARLAVERAVLVRDNARTTFDRLNRLVPAGATEVQRQDADLVLRSAEIALQDARRILREHVITAPISGFAGIVDARPGDLVAASTILTGIEDRSVLNIDFRVPERVAPMIGLNDRVLARPLSGTPVDLTGKIVALDNRLDEQSRTLRVQASFDNAEDALRVGMAFRIRLDFSGAEHPSVDPLAIQWASDGAFVWVVREGRSERVSLRILQRNASTVLVDAAFRPGDLVVTEGVQSLRPGGDVTIAKPSADPSKS